MKPAKILAYEAARWSNQHKSPKYAGSGDQSVGVASHRLRDWARWFDENHDIVTGALDKLTNFIVGREILITPMVKNRRGELLPRVNDAIRRALLDMDNPRSWSRDVNVTGEYTRGEQEWTACRSWLRDGEILARKVSRRTSSGIAYQVQLIESDYLPFDFIASESETGNPVVQGVEKDEWGRPVAYHFYRNNPADLYYNLRVAGRVASLYGDLVIVPAREIQHLKFARRRANQTRGVPIFHSCIYRLDDIADYETSHRVAARVGAQLLGAVNKSPDMIDDGMADERDWEMENGQIITDLLPGESLNWYKPEAPNPDATPFLDDQLRRAAAGFGLGYSTFSGKYDKSFSAARQEQSENWPNIEVLRSQFIDDFVRPCEYEPALEAAIQSGAVRIPVVADPATIFAADFRGPPRPTIDDLKQAQSDAVMIEIGTDSRHGRIRERSRNPVAVDAEIQLDMFNVQRSVATEPQSEEPRE